MTNSPPTEVYHLELLDIEALLDLREKLTRRLNDIEVELENRVKESYPDSSPVFGNLDGEIRQSLDPSQRFFDPK